MSVIAAVGLNPTSSLAVPIRRNRGYAVRSIDAMAPGPSVPPYSMPIRTLSKTRPEALIPKGPWWLKPVWALSWLDPNFTYGGGSATIGTLHRVIVERRKWLTEEPFQLSYALSRLTPGTNLLAFSACVGYLLRRTPGAFGALLARGRFRARAWRLA